MKTDSQNGEQYWPSARQWDGLIGDGLKGLIAMDQPLWPVLFSKVDNGYDRRADGKRGPV